MIKQSILLLSAILASQFCQAGGFSIYPNRVDMDPTKYRQSFTLSHDDATAKLIQIRLYQWTQQQGEEQNTPSRDMIISPQMIEVGPGETKTVRAGFRKPPAASQELTYRIEFKEISKTTQTASGITFNVTQSVPVYYRANQNWKADISSALVQQNGKLLLRIHNSGNKHYIAKNATLSANEQASWQWNKAFAVLSQSYKDFELPNGISTENLLLRVQGKRSSVELKPRIENP